MEMQGVVGGIRRDGEIHQGDGQGGPEKGGGLKGAGAYKYSRMVWRMGGVYRGAVRTREGGIYQD